MAGSVCVESFGESTAFGGDDRGELKLIVVGFGQLGVAFIELEAGLHCLLGIGVMDCCCCLLGI